MQGMADREAAHETDEPMARWRQGDLALDERWFVHVGLDTVDEAPSVLTTETMGLMAVSQTCDLVRSHLQRPFAEFAPLMAVGPAVWQSAWRGERPSMATLQALSSSGLVADLDRAVTVEKKIVARWLRTEGCSSEEEMRRLADGLARHRQRFAFPDEFSRFARRLVGTIKEKHGRASPMGVFLAALREIRVHAVPSWKAHSISLQFWFILQQRPDDEERRKLYREAENLLAKLSVPDGAFQDLQLAALLLPSEMTAAEYLNSERLDLDYLTDVGKM